MLYKPNKKETKQLKELNKAYKMISEAFKLIIKNSPRNDGEISVYTYRATKNIDKLIKKTAILLEAQYMKSEFFDIVDSIKITNKRNNRKKK